MTGIRESVYRHTTDRSREGQRDTEIGQRIDREDQRRDRQEPDRDRENRGKDRGIQIGS